MIKKLSLILLIFSFSNIYAVHDSTSVDPPIKYEDLWKRVNNIGVSLSEMAFVNWNAGGNNSVTGLLNAEFSRRYKDTYYLWNNIATVNYGLNAQEGRELRKTEDELSIRSTFGYRKDTLSNWYYSAKFDFRTQFTKGYQYPDTEAHISNLLAPGYTFIGIGAEYSSPDEVWSAYASPLTMKSTFVLDQRLANEGMFGVTGAVRDEEGNIIEEGENVRTEIGILLTNTYSREIFKNIKLDNQLSLYTDYLNKFGNIDVDWQMNVNLIVNEYVKANIGTHIRYDDDVKYKEDTNGDGELETFGPRIQLKQVLGVGLLYSF